MQRKSIKDIIKPYLPVAIIVLYRLLRKIIAEIFYEFIIIRIEVRRNLFKSQMIENFDIEKILSNNWPNYRSDLFPKDRRMSVIRLKEVAGMCTENTAFLIDEIVRVIAYKGVYLEVGTFNGYSLFSAALFNPKTRCIGIDNFSQFDSEHKNENALRTNIKKFHSPKNIEFYNMDYKDAVGHLFSKEPNLKINVYYYDGEHSYENQLEGLRIMLPYLSERCIILVDDVNYERVDLANRDFITQHPEFKSIFKIKTERNGSKTWWNGFEVIARGF